MNTIWIKAAFIRAVKTMAQTAGALIGTGAIGILDVDWISVLSASALAGVLAILTSIAGLPEVGVKEQERLMEKEELPDDYFEGGEYDGEC